MAGVEFLYLSQDNVVAAGGLDMDGTLATVEEASRPLGNQRCHVARQGHRPVGAARYREHPAAMAAHVGGRCGVATQPPEATFFRRMPSSASTNRDHREAIDIGVYWNTLEGKATATKKG